MYCTLYIAYHVSAYKFNIGMTNLPIAINCSSKKPFICIIIMASVLKLVGILDESICLMKILMISSMGLLGNGQVNSNWNPDTQ